MSKGACVCTVVEFEDNFFAGSENIIRVLVSSELRLLILFRSVDATRAEEHIIVTVVTRIGELNIAPFTCSFPCILCVARVITRVSSAISYL